MKRHQSRFAQGTRRGSCLNRSEGTQLGPLKSAYDLLDSLKVP